MADPVDYDCNDDEIPINVCLTTVLLYLCITIVSGFLLRIFTLSQTGSQSHVHYATLSNDGPILQYS